MYPKLYNRPTHGGDLPRINPLRNVLQKPVNFPPKCMFATCERSFASLHAFIANTEEEYNKLPEDEYERLMANEMFQPDGSGVPRTFHYHHPQWGLVAHAIVGLPLNPQDPTFGDYDCCRTSLTTAPVGDIVRTTTTPVKKWKKDGPNPFSEFDQSGIIVERVDFETDDEPVNYINGIEESLERLQFAQSRLDEFPKTNSGEITEEYRQLSVILSPERSFGPRYFMEISGETVRVTNAYLKMLELFRIPGVVPEAAIDRGIVKAFFPAEAPGSSIFALGYALREADIGGSVATRAYYNWYANSLVDGFKDTYRLIRDNPERWLQVMPDMANTGGDIVEHYEQIAAKAQEMSNKVPEQSPESYGMRPPAEISKGYDMIVADGGRGVELSTDGLDYSHESDFNLQIIVSEGAFIKTLNPGGSACIKTYWLGSVDNPRITLIYLMFIRAFYESFEDVYITKPRFSRFTNQEVYIVGTGFRAYSPLFEEARLLSNDPSLPVPEDAMVPSSVLDTVTNFQARQMGMLDRLWLIRLWAIDLVPGSPYEEQQRIYREQYETLDDVLAEHYIPDEEDIKDMISRLLYV